MYVRVRVCMSNYEIVEVIGQAVDVLEVCGVCLGCGELETNVDLGQGYNRECWACKGTGIQGWSP